MNTRASSINPELRGSLPGRLLRLLVTLIAVSGLFPGCGDELTASEGAEGSEVTRSNAGEVASALEVLPRIEVIGLDAIHDAFELTHLNFQARLYLLPTHGAGSAVTTGLSVEFDGVQAITRLDEAALALSEPGTYEVLLGVYPDEGRASVVLGGNYDDEELTDPVRTKDGDADDPVPVPADPVPVPADNPADDPGSEPSSMGDPDQGDTPDPDGAGGPGDPSGSGADPVPVPADPVPVPADPVPVPAQELPDRNKAELPGEAGYTDLDQFDGYEGFDAPVFVQSRRSFEFRVGQVELTEGASELLVTWDVSDWLSTLVIEAFGESSAEPTREAPGFGDDAHSFRIDIRE